MITMQEINLYQPAAKGVRGMLSARSTSIVLALVGATLLGFWGFGWWQLHKMQGTVQMLRNQQAAQIAMASQQGPQLDGLTDDQLQTLVDEMDASMNSKSTALSLLAGESTGARNGFSSRLRAFGTRGVEGVWLERLTLGATVESVSITGSTMKPESVPSYLRSLAADPALKGGKIDDFIIEKPTKKTSGRLSFRAGHRGMVIPETTSNEPVPEEKS